jgi:hypothetical protein
MKDGPQEAQSLVGHREGRLPVTRAEIQVSTDVGRAEREI